MESARPNFSARDATRETLGKHTELAWHVLAQETVLYAPSLSGEALARSLPLPTAEVEALWERSPNKPLSKTSATENSNQILPDIFSSDGEDLDVDDFMEKVLYESGAFAATPTTPTSTSLSSIAEEVESPLLNGNASIFIPVGSTSQFAPAFPAACPPLVSQGSYMAPSWVHWPAPTVPQKALPERFSQSRAWAVRRLAQLEESQAKASKAAHQGAGTN